MGCSGNARGLDNVHRQLSWTVWFSDEDLAIASNAEHGSRCGHSQSLAVQRQGVGLINVEPV